MSSSYKISFENNKILFYDDSNLFFQDRCGPYVTRMELSPFGSMTENEFPVKFLDPQTVDMIACWNCYENTSTHSIIHDNSLSYYNPAQTGTIGRLVLNTSGSLILDTAKGHAFMAKNYSTNSSFRTNDYWSVILNPSGNSSLSTSIDSIVFNTYRSQTGPTKLSVQFRVDDMVWPDLNNSLCISLDSSNQYVGFGVVPPYGIQDMTKKVEMRLYAANASSTNGTFGFCSTDGNRNIGDCLTILGKIKGENFNFQKKTFAGQTEDEEDDEENGIVPKAINQPQWSSPTGMFVAKELYRYDFNNSQRLDLVEVDCYDARGNALTNCRCNQYENLSFDFCNNIGYEVAVLPMAWDPEYQKYVLSSLNLSLNINWKFGHFDNTPSDLCSDIFVRNFNPETYDDKTTHTSANFSVNKSDCFTTSGYNDIGGKSGIEEYVSSNFSYYISADYCGLNVFTSSPTSPPVTSDPIITVSETDIEFETQVGEISFKTFRVQGENLSDRVISRIVGNRDVFSTTIASQSDFDPVDGRIDTTLTAVFYPDTSAGNFKSIYVLMGRNEKKTVTKYINFHGIAT